jgi:hypothetical protein
MGVNAFVRADMSDSEESLNFRNMTTEYKILEWNWDDLIQLMDSYCTTFTPSSNDNSGNSSENSTASNNTSGSNDTSG